MKTLLTQATLITVPFSSLWLQLLHINNCAILCRPQMTTSTGHDSKEARRLTIVSRLSGWFKTKFLFNYYSLGDSVNKSIRCFSSTNFLPVLSVVYVLTCFALSCRANHSTQFIWKMSNTYVRFSPLLPMPHSATMRHKIILLFFTWLVFLCFSRLIVLNKPH